MTPAETTAPDPIAPVDLAAERAELGPDLEEAVLRTLRSGAFVLGPEVEGFEAEFAHYQRCTHGIGVASGTDALILAMHAAGVKPGDHVVTSPFTFFASAGTMAWVGARPVFADVELDTALLDPKEAASAIDDKTTCILPIHLYGQLADMDAFSSLASKRGLMLLEDAAQAHGAERDGYRAGERSLAAGFSFYPTKNLGAAGDAGLVTTQHEEINVALRRLRDHGSPKKYEHASIGTNSRLASLQAACLRVKLPHLEAWNDRRRANAKHYDQAF
ncbi:MAG: DegT/DnrJ/EryC1/StrS family aminotransferase, partial [Planctomycetota bacterium]